MLQSLSIRDYALIEELDVAFDSGLNIITGETGAGKSILIGALKMILGERASMEVVRDGARKAVIEGIFSTVEMPGVNALLEENEIDPLPRIILRREISSSYSRAFINDTPATIQVMRQVASLLLDLHGQHEHQSLLREETHLELLDNFGSLGGLVEQFRRKHQEVAVLKKERGTLISRERELSQQKELYAFQLEDIDKIDPVVGEEEALETEHRVLENAERLYEVTAELYTKLYESDGAVHDQLVFVRNELQDLTHIDLDFDDTLNEIRSAQIIVSEAAQFLQDYNARIEFNQERLEHIRERLGELEHLKRKYGGTLDAVLAYREKIAETHHLANNFEQAIFRLDERIETAQAELSEAAIRLTVKRNEVARRIERAIVAECAKLGMPNCRFEVRFTNRPDPQGWIQVDEKGGIKTRYATFANGMDEVAFFISTNLGESPKPLIKVASGGEISRIMLALKTILAKSERLPILVFDEIDSGISGNMARLVGDSMHDLAYYHQIIAITHLPQIAALGDMHFLVEKFMENDRTKTRIRRLSDEERAHELAGLISGAEVTDAALESARELMSVAHK